MSPTRDDDDREVREAPRESEGVEEVGGGHEPRHADAERGDAEEKRGRRRRRGRRGGRNREGREGHERTAHAGGEREHGGERQPPPEAHHSGDWNGQRGGTRLAKHRRTSPQPKRRTIRTVMSRMSRPSVQQAQSHREVEEQRAGDMQRTPEPAHAADADRFAQSEPVRTPPPVESDEPAQPARKGWWQKRFGSP